MKKTLFLLLFLQANLVFGQVKLADNLRASTFEMPDLYNDEYFMSVGNKKIKKVEVEYGDALIKGNFNENRRVEYIEIEKQGTKYRIFIGYNDAGLVESEITESEVGQKGFNTLHEYEYFRFKNPKDSTDNLLCLEVWKENVIAIYLQKIYHNVLENHKVLIDSKKLRISASDTTQIKKLIEPEEVLKNYQLKNITQCNILKYKYEKEKLISTVLSMNFDENKSLLLLDQLQYVNDKSGYVYRDGKLINIFFIESNWNYYNPLYSQTKVQSDIKYKLDNYGNWTMKMLPFTDKGKNNWFEIKRKIEYYD